MAALREHHSEDKSAMSEQVAAEVRDVLILARVESDAHTIEVVTAPSIKRSQSVYHSVQGRAAAIEVAEAQPGQRPYLNVVDGGAP